MSNVEQWGMFEVELDGPSDGNPFLDVEVRAEFTHKDRTFEAPGFYDGNGKYRVRCMPEHRGEWSYVTKSSCSELDGKTGKFTCIAPGKDNHGPVGVHNTYHFAYADGTPHASFGTTCYAWIHQTEELQQLTLKTLKTAPFNKMRMCVFPKDYIFNKNEPSLYAFEKKDDGSFDFARFDPQFFARLEKRVGQLRDMLIEADLIIFHPYDRWGFARMSAESNDRYLRYLVARLSAFRNVWWSMANEWDLMKNLRVSDWDRFFQIVRDTDPYDHLRGVHNCREWYDHNKEWVLHQSIQSGDVESTLRWREKCAKPVVNDECKYEGNIRTGWGQISAKVMVYNFWATVARGGYCGHGETYEHQEEILWWSKGGELHGESPARIGFLRKIIEEAPPYLEPFAGSRRLAGLRGGDDYRLIYLGQAQPATVEVQLPVDLEYEVDVIDTWDMTVTTLDGTYSGNCDITFTGKEYQALRIRRV